MNKYTTQTYEITFKELMEAVQTIILRNDPTAGDHLVKTGSTKWLEIDDNKGVPTNRKEIVPSSTVFLSIETENPL